MSRVLVAAAVAAALGTSWAGAAGAAPRAASSDPNLFASVSASGTVLAGTPGTTVTSPNPGQYLVTFSQDVSACAYVATTVNAQSQAAAMTWVASGQVNPDQVFVETQAQDSSGFAATPFNLVVDCGQPGWMYAVVGYTNNLVAATPGTKSHFLSPGRYDVTFPTSVQDCAYLASSGDPSSGGSISAPNGVYTGSSTNPDQVYVETKNAGGGLSRNLPFRLEVICPGAVDTDFAVVDASGADVRDSGNVSSANTGTGQYVVTTGHSLAACAVVATRGSVDTSVPFTPTTVAVTPGPENNAIGIQVSDLLFFGGNPDDQSFHVAAVC